MTFKIQVYNNIAQKGLEKFKREYYEVSNHEILQNPDAIILRSQKLSVDMIPRSVFGIARAGSGVNNLPVDELTALGIPVFNTPGANANAVKELVLAGMLLSARHVCRAWDYVNQLSKNNNNSNSTDDLNATIEQAKKQFKGTELPGKKLAIIGLGSIGVKVANSASSLGMTVIGYDPHISVERAWELSSSVKKAKSLLAAVKDADYISVHVPLTSDTESLIDKNILSQCKPTAVLLNFARDNIVDQAALASYLQTNQLACYVTDFPSRELLQFTENPTMSKVIALPHIGASTYEAEENCAVWAVCLIKNFLEAGTIQNSVNFPEVVFNEDYKYRLAIVNKNIPNMVAQFTSILAKDKLNIVDLINKSRNNIAYSLIDLNNKPSDSIISSIKAIDGVLAARQIHSKHRE